MGSYDSFMVGRREPGPERWRAPAGPLRVGVSRCLLGEKVRYDGQHKRDGFVVDRLGPFVEWVPVCPEVEVGMGIPREPVRLVQLRREPAVRMLGVKSEVDWTDRMNAWAERKARALVKEDLSGFILKKGSPSCGLDRVKVYPGEGEGAPARDGVGLFAAALGRALPDLPLEEEGRLADPLLRESFVERLFAHHRARALFEGRWTLGELVAFHTAHKLALLAHSPEGYRRLGRIVAGAKAAGRQELRAAYLSGLGRTLARPATTGRHVNVLEHAAGHLKRRLDPISRGELVETIRDFGRRLIPLVVPLTLLRHHARVHDVSYLLGQTYLDPHPKELLLRNHS